MKTITWLVMMALSYGATETRTFDSGTAGNLPSGWMSSGPAWRVVKDSTAPTQPYVLAHFPPEGGTAGLAPAILENPDFSNGEVSVKFKALSGTPEQDAGLIWRYRDERNYYLVRADARGNNVAMFKVENGVRTPLVPRGRTPGSYAIRHRVRPDDWNILKVTFSGPNFAVYYDHRRILQVDDRTFARPGRVGLWTRPASAARFDNFRVVSKP
jgi:hypothetical protein